MQVGAISFQPYIYNTNSLSSSSLNKISGISDDLTSQKTDYSGLTDTEENVNSNPLKRGESASFMDILAMQMQMGRNNAARVMKEPEPSQIPDEQEISLQAVDDMAEQLTAQTTTVAQAAEQPDLMMQMTAGIVA